MRIALVAAVLLISIAVPTASAATLQLVTENGNVFSIDFDEILAIWEKYNPTNSTSTTFTNATQAIIDSLNNRIADLETNSTDTSEIDALTDLVNELQMELDNLNSTTTLSNSTLNQILTSLEESLEKELLSRPAGVGIDALGNSGRLITLHTSGILVHGTHTDYDTRGTVNATIPYFHHNYDFDWAALIQDDDPYDEYTIPDFAEEYAADTSAHTLGVDRDTTNAIHIIRTNRMGGNSLYTSTTSGIDITGDDQILLEINKRRLGGIGEIDFVLQGGATVKIVRSPNNLMNAGYHNGEFNLFSGSARSISTTEQVYDNLVLTIGHRLQNPPIPYFERDGECRETGSVHKKYYTCKLDVFVDVSRTIPTQVGVYVSTVTGSWDRSDITMRENHGFCLDFDSYLYFDWRQCSIETKSHTVTSPTINSHYVDGLYYIQDISHQTTQSEHFFEYKRQTPYQPGHSSPSYVSTYLDFTKPVAAKGTWRISDAAPYVVLDALSSSGQASFALPNDRLYILASPNGGTVSVEGNVVSSLVPEIAVSGLEPNKAWAIHSDSGLLYAGTTNNAGEVLVSRTPNDGVTITRTSSFDSSPDIRIPDRGTYYDTIAVTDYGTVNDLHVTIDSSSSYYVPQLIAPSGTIYPAGTALTKSNIRTYSFNDAAGEQIQGDWTLAYKTTRYSPILREWTLEINHGNTGKVNSVTGSGSQYAVEVGQAYSGTYGLDLMDANGIRDSSNYPYDYTIPPTLSEVHDASGAVVEPNRGDPLHVYSITRHNPSTEHSSTSSLEYLVTFNKPVTNVNATDFVHTRPGPATLTRTQSTPTDVWYTGSSSSLSTYSSAPTVTLPYATYTTDTITVPDSGNATVVSVAVNITHNYIGDLSVKLIAPDGTIKTAHSYTGGSSDHINQTYEIDFGSVPINGDWQLRIYDRRPANTGTLNSWSITPNPDAEGIPSTSALSVSSLYAITNATLILNATAINNQFVSEWRLNLTSPGPDGTTMVITDASQSSLDNAGGIHEFYLGEMIGIDPPNGNWILTATDVSYDDDPGAPNPCPNPCKIAEGQITEWTLEFEHSYAHGTVGTVRTEGTEGNQYIIPVTGVGGYTDLRLWLKGDSDVEASGETINHRETKFAPDPHEHYNRGTISIPSTPHIRTISVASSTSNTVTFNVAFSEAVTGVNATDFVVIENGSPENNPRAFEDTNAPNIVVSSSTGVDATDTIIVSGQSAATVGTVTLDVDISHTRIGDLEVELVSPAGTMRRVHDNTGTTTVDLMTSYTPSFASESLDGTWTLRVRDNGSTVSSGTLNSWSLDFSYEDTPANYEEFQEVAATKGDAYTWKDIPTGPHTLRVYHDALINEYCSGILFDAHNHASGCFPYSKSSDLIFTANAYLKQTATVDVFIRNVFLAPNSDCSGGIYFDINKEFEPNESLIIPILPDVNTLCMNVSGIDLIMPIQDRLSSSAVQSMPTAKAFGPDASTSTGTSTYARVNGTMTAVVSVTADAGLNIDQMFDFTDRYQVTSGLLQTFLYNRALNGWTASYSSPSSIDGYIVTLNAYVNGNLADTFEETTSSVHASGNVVSSDVVPFRGTQKGTVDYDSRSVEHELIFQVQEGDFVQIEAVLHASDSILSTTPRDRIVGVAYHCDTWHVYTRVYVNVGGPGEYIYEWQDRYREAGEYLGRLPSGCHFGYQESANMLNPNAEPILNGSNSIWKELHGGYVIFTGQ